MLWLYNLTWSDSSQRQRLTCLIHWLKWISVEQDRKAEVQNPEQMDQKSERDSAKGKGRGRRRICGVCRLKVVCGRERQVRSSYQAFASLVLTRLKLTGLNWLHKVEWWRRCGRWMERNEEGNVRSVAEVICLGRWAMYCWAMELYEVVDFLEMCNFC